MYVFLLKELDYEQSMLFGGFRRTRKKVSEKKVVGVPLGTLCKLTSIFHEFFFWFVELHRKAGTTCSLLEHISPCERSPVECVKVKRKKCRTFRFLSSSLRWRLVGHNLDLETITYSSFPFHWKSKSSFYQKVSSYNEFFSTYQSLFWLISMIVFPFDVRLLSGYVSTIWLSNGLWCCFEEYQGTEYSGRRGL